MRPICFCLPYKCTNLLEHVIDIHVSFTNRNFCYFVIAPITFLIYKLHEVKALQHVGQLHQVVVIFVI